MDSMQYDVIKNRSSQIDIENFLSPLDPEIRVRFFLAGVKLCRTTESAKRDVDG